MDFVLFDTPLRSQLFPFTHTRPVAGIRCGIWTIQEKWEFYLQGKASVLTLDYLMEVFNPNSDTASLYINAHYFPKEEILEQIKSLEDDVCLVWEEEIIAFKTHATDIRFENWQEKVASFKKVKAESALNCIQQVWDIFSQNGAQIQADFACITQQSSSQPIPEGVTALHPENIFIAPGAKVLPCIINATNAKVYIGPDAEIMEGSMLRGNIALCEHAVIKMGTKVYSDTTIGPYCKVGGEIQNVVFFAYSNKGHDGYLGNAVIGEWCNIGADTNSSNLKNDYGFIDIHSEQEGKLIPTGLQFCGLMMGDHSKCGINTMFNTATVVGVSCNIFGADFPPKFIPSFSWGGSRLLITYQIEKAFQTANSMMERRGKQLSAAEQNMFRYIFEHSPIHQMRSRNKN